MSADYSVVFAVARRAVEDYGTRALESASARAAQFSEDGDEEAARLWRRVYAILEFWSGSASRQSAH